jgi:uncharacterized protein (TIGR02594 family)
VSLRNLICQLLGCNREKSVNNPPETLAAEANIDGTHLGYERRVWVQRKLKAVGLYNAKLYRDFVPALVRAVKDFQAIKGLYVDGIVGPQTWDALLKQPDGKLVVEREAEAVGATWYNEAVKLLGLTEIVGPEDNPLILKMFEVSGHSWVQDDETAWCAAFENYILFKGGYRGTGKLTARSFETYGKALPIDGPIPKGAILVFPRGNHAWQGHVTNATGREKMIKGKLHIEALGGNQNNAVNKRWYLKEKLITARWPTVKDKL